MTKAPSILLIIVLVLAALGIVMLASTSSVRGGRAYQDPSHFLKRQVVWLLLGILVAFAAAFLIDYHWWQRLVIPIIVLCVVSLLLVFVPNVGRKVGGARRWVGIGSMNVGQPSEFAKFAVIIMLSAWMTRIGRRASRLKEGLLLPLGALGVILVLVIAEPDYGTTFLIGLVGLSIMFAGGTRLSHLIISGTIGVCAFALAILQSPVRMRRFMAFCMPEKYPDAAYQMKQSVSAFILGGASGVGLGRSLQKHSYLPEAHTDFILAIIGEELGVVASLAVVVLFAGMLVCGILICLNARDVFGRLVAFGITTMIALQTVINIGVVTGCLPTKGLPLPFISAGGSSLVMSLLCVGVLLNIARHSSGKVVDKHTGEIKDRCRRG